MADKGPLNIKMQIRIMMSPFAPVGGSNLMFIFKGQENPKFCASVTFGSFPYNPVVGSGTYGNYPVGPEILSCQIFYRSFQKATTQISSPKLDFK